MAEKFAPHAPVSHHQHNDMGEEDTDAHIKPQIIGHEVLESVTEGWQDFGTREQVLHGEFDERRRVLVKIIGE